MAADYTAKGLTLLFQAPPFVISTGGEKYTRAELVKHEGLAESVVFRLREMVGQTLLAEGDPDEEIQRMLSLTGRGR